MGTPETGQGPCPNRIVDDAGMAFGMGAIGGSAYHFVRGMYKSPGGRRFAGGSDFVRMHVPRMAGSWGAWGGLFSAFDCTLVSLRRKEDPWNSIMAGAATSGLLTMRNGLRATAYSAACGGLLLALFQGSFIMLNKFLQERQQLAEELARAGFPGQPEALELASAPSSDSWFVRWFGGRNKNESQSSGGGSETNILESFDAPFVPSFSYE